MPGRRRAIGTVNPRARTRVAAERLNDDDEDLHGRSCERDCWQRAKCRAMRPAIAEKPRGSPAGMFTEPPLDVKLKTQIRYRVTAPDRGGASAPSADRPPSAQVPGRGRVCPGEPSHGSTWGCLGTVQLAGHGPGAGVTSDDKRRSHDDTFDRRFRRHGDAVRHPGLRGKQRRRRGRDGGSPRHERGPKPLRATAGWSETPPWCRRTASRRPSTPSSSEQGTGVPEDTAGYSGLEHPDTSMTAGEDTSGAGWSDTTGAAGMDTSGMSGMSDTTGQTGWDSTAQQ